MQTHHRVVATKPGSAENLQMVEEAAPQATGNEVRVRIEASGVSWGDIMMRRGIFFGGKLNFPISLGYDIVGRVDMLGQDGHPALLGRRVAYLGIQTGYSEFVCVPAPDVVEVPEGVDAAEAVACVLNYTTAYQMLHRATKLRPGQKILIFGAAGGVGTALLELAKLRGLEVYGAASSGKRDVVESYGARWFESRTPNAIEKISNAIPSGFDAVFDPFAGSHVWKAFKLVRRGGLLIAFGISDALKDGKKDLSAVFSMMALLGIARLNPRKHAKLYAIDQVMKSNRGSINEDLSKIFALLAQGAIKPKIDRRLRLDRAEEAHRILETSGASGKIVLLPSAV